MKIMLITIAEPASMNVDNDRISFLLLIRKIDIQFLQGIVSIRNIFNPPRDKIRLTPGNWRRKVYPVHP